MFNFSFLCIQYSDFLLNSQTITNHINRTMHYTKLYEIPKREVTSCQFVHLLYGCKRKFFSFCLVCCLAGATQLLYALTFLRRWENIESAPHIRHFTTIRTVRVGMCCAFLCNAKTSCLRYARNIEKQLDATRWSVLNVKKTQENCKTVYLYTQVVFELLQGGAASCLRSVFLRKFVEKEQKNRCVVKLIFNVAYS